MGEDLEKGEMAQLMCLSKCSSPFCCAAFHLFLSEVRLAGCVEVEDQARSAETGSLGDITISRAEQSRAGGVALREVLRKWEGRSM